MADAKLVSFIADLKLTPQGEVRILELGSAFWSGFSGYERAAGKNPVEAFVFPFYESFGIPVYRTGYLNGLRYDNKLLYSKDVLPCAAMPVNLKDSFDPASLSSHAAIVMVSGYSYRSERKSMREELYNRFIVTNQNPLANACFENKALFHALSSGLIPQLLPKQRIYPVDSGKVDTGKILQDFAGSRTIVAKVPVLAQGRGVDVIDAQELKAIHDRAGDNTRLALLNQFRKDDVNLCVVQDFVPGRLITAVNEAGESGQYEPTIRVLMTAWHDNGITQVKCHDAYYKIPGRPAGEKRERASTVSDVHDKGGPKSALVEEEVKAQMFLQLENGLAPLFDMLLTTTPAEKARKLMASEDEATRRAGLAIATDSRFFDFPEGEKEYPEDLAKQVVDLKYAWRPLAEMMNKNADNPDWSSLLGDMARITEDTADRMMRPRSYKSAAKWGLGAAAGIALLSYVGFSLGGGDYTAQDIFNHISDGGHAITNLENARYTWVELQPENMAGRKQGVTELAAAAGYNLCSAVSQGAAGARMLPIYQMAVNAPSEKFFLINFIDKSDKEGEPATDTLIFGTKCPVP